LRHVSVDQSKCFGCKICEIVCSFTNEREINPKLARIKIEPKLEKVLYHVCHKCDTPVCVNSCPIHAIEIRNGQFTLTKQCIKKCSLCIDACPHKAIVYTQGKVDVCNLCGECIKFCPVQAIQIVERGGSDA
jgi:carbon-monoxide dehydrogenase iron sulfur subunit